MIKNKSILIFILTITAFFAFGLGVMTVFAASTEEAVFSGEKIETKYTFNSRFSAPEGSLSFNGETKEAEATLYFPDGTATKAKMVLLNQEGVYKLEYGASFFGETKKYSMFFKVEKNLFTVEKASSSVAYGTYKTSDHDSNGLNIISGEVSGAYVHLASGDTLHYNKVINLANKTQTDTFIRLVMTPSEIGIQDVGAISIILTDAYDSSNYVTINVLDSGEEWGAAYVKAAASCGQLLSGWDYSGNRLVTGSNPYGFPVYFLFSANANYRNSINKISLNSLSFAMDYDSKAIYSTGNQNPTYSSMIADLDSEEDFGNVWNGFTTGECFISIKCNEYITSTAEFVITEIMGEQITSTDEFVRSAPNIVVDFENYDESALPVGEVNKEYTLFKIKGVSPYDGKVQIVQKVYFDYSGAKREVSFFDGKFVPDKAGTYTVEITASDFLGQTRIKTYNVIVQTECAAITITPNGKYATSAVAGHEVALAQVTAIGGSGRLTVKYFIVTEGTATIVENGIFRPTKQGSYTVLVEATDFLGNSKKFEYQLNVAAGTKPIFTEALNLPKYFISGMEYVLPDIEAKNYTDGSGNAVFTSIRYTDSKGVKNAINRKIVPVVANSGDYTKVTYVAEINGVEETLTKEVPTIIVRNSKGIAIERLFVAHGANVVTPTKYNYLKFDFFEDTSYDFINPAIANGIDVRFSGEAIDVNFEKVVITLTDSLNSSQSSTLSYTTDANGAVFSLNNGANTYKISKSLTKSSDIIAFSLDDVNHLLRFDTGSTLKIKVKEYANGNEYNGFESGLVYVTFSFEGVQSASSFKVNNIAGKMLNNSTTDVARPKIAFMGDYGGNAALGSTVTLPKIVAADVIDGKVPVYMSVFAPDGSVMKAVNGVRLENVLTNVNYDISLPDYGRYLVKINTSDADGNIYSYQFEIRVEDDIPPDVSVRGVPATGKLGEKIVLPEASVTDNISSKENLTVKTYLVTNTGNIYKLDSMAFVPQYAGVYMVRYYCTDAVGNLTVVSFEITVS